jgi:hypothetical protein
MLISPNSLGVKPSVSGLGTNGNNPLRQKMINYKDPPSSPSVNERIMKEIGTPGIDVFAGIIQQAYLRELDWPNCWPVYSKLWRSDPEVAICRLIFSSLASKAEMTPQLPDDPTDDDKKARDFLLSEMDNVEGGFEKFRDKMVSVAPFYGWGIWEMIPGIRKKDWVPPEDDPWRSEQDDGLIGIRRIAFRDHGSFYRWDFDEKMRIRGMWQMDSYGEEFYIPISRCMHIKFGNEDSPEGQSPLEALYRLERYKFGLELVQGIGFEHSAGFLSVAAESEITDDDIAAIKKAARAALTAMEGNYATWPNGLQAELMASPFSAAEQLGFAIRYYGMLKLQLFNLQWVSLSTTSEVGSFAAMKDSSLMYLATFNAMMKGFANQINRSYVKQLFRFNAEVFPNLTRLPKLVPAPVRKDLDLADFGEFIKTFYALFEATDDDIIAIRKHTQILSETLPTEETKVETKEDKSKERFIANLEKSTEAKIASGGSQEAPTEAEDTETSSDFDDEHEAKSFTIGDFPPSLRNLARWFINLAMRKDDINS